MPSIPSRMVGLWLLLLALIAIDGLNTSLAAAAAAAATTPAAAAAAAVDSTSHRSPQLLRTPSAVQPTLSSSDIQGSSSDLQGGQNSTSSNSSSSIDGPPLPGDTLSSSSSSSSSSGNSGSSSSGGGSVTAFGSQLRPYEQCGGIGGSCNSTTIGVPCGDHVWNEVLCPVYFYCSRKNSSFWQCEPQPQDSLRQPMHQQNTSSAPQSIPVVNNTGVVTSDGQFTEAAAVGDGSSSSSAAGSGQSTVIRVCGPGAAKGLTMCNTSVAPDGVVLLNNSTRSSGASAAARAGLSSSLVVLSWLLSALTVIAAFG